LLPRNAAFALVNFRPSCRYLCSVRRLSEVHARERAGDSVICGHIKHAANGLLFVATLQQLLLPVVIRSSYRGLVVADGPSV